MPLLLVLLSLVVVLVPDSHFGSELSNPCDGVPQI